MGTLFAQLDAEWHRLSASATLADRYRPLLRRAGDAADWAEAQRWMRDPAVTAEAKDAVLAGLVEVASRHDDTTAARIVLALLTPGLVTELNAHRRRTGAASAVLDDEVTVAGLAWTLICDYPIDRRPRRIAANIVLDLRKHLCRLAESADHLDRHAPTDGLEIPDPLGGGHEAMEDLRVIVDHAVAASVIDPGEAALILSTRLYGARIDDLARRARTSPRTLRRRRLLAERTLIAHAQRSFAA